MKLLNPTNDILDAAFAEHVCGWTRIKEARSVAFVSPLTGARGIPPKFTNSMDAVLLWLDKTAGNDGFWRMTSNGSGVSVVINYEQYQITDTAARAAVIAILRAHGVEVEFT